jgi:hypothetical protein
MDPCAIHRLLGIAAKFVVHPCISVRLDAIATCYEKAQQSAWYLFHTATPGRLCSYFLPFLYVRRSPCSLTLTLLENPPKLLSLTLSTKISLGIHRRFIAVCLGM